MLITKPPSNTLGVAVIKIMIAFMVERKGIMGLVFTVNQSVYEDEIYLV